MHSENSTITPHSPPKSGAPAGNQNGIKHGLTAGTLPPGCGYVKRISKRFRDDLAQAVQDVKDEITITDACTIDTAARWHRHGLLAQRWLRNESETMTPDQKLSFSREIARAGTERDRCIKSLGLDLCKVDALTVAYRDPQQKGK